LFHISRLILSYERNLKRPFASEVDCSVLPK
jgi:hypothetical protein